jgi:hypothetical protein
LLAPLLSEAQAVTKTREVLHFFETNNLAISKKCLKVLSDFVIHSETVHYQKQLESSRLELHQQIQHFHKKELPKNEFALKTEYSRFLSGLDEFAAKLRNLAVSANPGDVLQLRQQMLQDFHIAEQAAIRLEEEVAIFCIENRLNKPEDGSRTGKLFREARQRLAYLISIQELLLPVISFEQHCVNNFGPDSLCSADKRRIEFAGLVWENNIKLKNLPACCGDRQVKSAALNSFRLLAIEAKNDLPHLEKFVHAEQEFILHHQQIRGKVLENQAEKEAYRDAVRKYNADIKAANQLVHQLEKTREEHLDAYYSAQKEFMETWLTAFPE